MTEIGDTTVFSQVDANNNTITNPGWPEGMAPSRVNDAARALQGAIARKHDYEFVHDATFTGNALSVSYAQAPSAYYNGMRFRVSPNALNTGATTFGVSGSGLPVANISIPARGGSPAPTPAGFFQPGMQYDLVYIGGYFSATPVTGPMTGLVNFSPVVTFDTPSSASFTPTSTTIAQYMRLNSQMIWLQLRMSGTLAKGAASGALKITGLPVSAVMNSPLSGTIVYWQGVSAAFAVPHVMSTASEIRFFLVGNGLSYLPLEASNLVVTSFSLAVSGFYVPA
jgi:hypothetical protein